MTSNHYRHNPPTANSPPSVTNIPKLESVIPQNHNNLWPLNQSNEFENREKYMETELTEEHHYLPCDISANQHEMPDDEPCPPPGLRRLVTGQPVSFDDSPNSPPFDRVVPGEGSNLTNYVGQPLPSSGNGTVSDRFVSGSTRKEFSPIPQHIFGPAVPLKQDTHQFFNNNNSYSNADAYNAFNVSSEDFFDSYLRTKNKSTERVNYPQQSLRNKPIQLFNAPTSQHQYPTMPRISTKSPTNLPFQNHQPRPLPMKSENSSCGHENSLERTIDDSFKTVNDVDESLVASNMDVGSGVNFQSSENILNSHENIGMRENEEKRARNNSVVDAASKKVSNRMVVEGSSNISQSKMLSSSTPVHSPSYDHWYQNNNEFALPSDVVKNHGYERTQNTQPLSTTGLFVPLTTHDTFKHSKTPSMSSNTSSANEIASYQQNENCVSFEKFQKHEEENCLLEGSVSRFIGQGGACQKVVETEERLAETRAQVLKLNEDSSYRSYGSTNKKSDNALEGSNKLSNLPLKGTDNYRENLMIGNDLQCASRLSREPVPGAQSVPGDGHKVLNNSSMNASIEFTHQMTNKFDTGVDERVLDMDEKQAMSQRTLPSHHQCNTIPIPCLNPLKLHTDLSAHANNTKPPLETRMVVGEISSDIPSKLTTSRSYNDEHVDDTDRERDYSMSEERNYRIVRNASHNEKSRKKSHQGRPKHESDEEFTESLAQGGDVDSERGSRPYRKKHQRDGSTRYKKGLSRLDCESSLTHDDSFNEDEDDDCDAYRRFENRKHPRGRTYMPYYADPVERDWNYYDRPSWDRYPEDMFQKNSRPSSRSGSDLRRDPMERGFKLPFYNFMEKMHPSTTSSEIHYWAKMRHSDPKGYMQWFRNMYPQEYSEWYYLRYLKQRAYQGDRRGSGHSGQSSVNNDSISVNEEKLMGLRDLTLSERNDDMERKSFIHEHRSSPLKFKIPHVKALFNSLGQLLIINESCPKEGQSADIGIYEVLPPDDDPDVVEFMNFTGPFIVGETHVNTVAEFVRYHAASASTSSEKLLYLFIELIIKLRGVTDGIAISELLMNTYRESQKPHTFSSKNDPPIQTQLKVIPSAMALLSENDIVEKYTNLLLQGDKNAALDLAICNKLWGHAFLLASKMGNKYYRSVLTKFDASITTNNPLKTFYQLYSHEIPQAATACADEKWGDWRPHLAMILSNPTADKEMDKTAILTLGDSLYSKDIFASHFCYLAAEANFDVFNKHSAKLSLLSLRNGVDCFGINTSNHAILLTQIYEFAKRLQQKEFTISALLPYKYLLAVRLIDFGKCDIAFQYLESIAASLHKNLEDSANIYLACNVVELADRIKYSDSKPLVTDQSTDPSWLTSLRELVGSNETQYKSPNSQKPQTDHQTSQLYQQSQLPLSLPIQQQQQQQPELQQEQSSISVQYPHIFSPSPQLSQQQPLMIPLDQPQTVSLSPLHEDQPTWDMNLQAVNNFHSSFTGPENYQNVSKLNNKSSFGEMDESNTNQVHERSNSVSDSQKDLYSPWDQPMQPTQISMHSTKNSFYDEGSSNSMPSSAHNRSEGIARDSSQVPTVEKLDGNSKEKKLEKENGGWFSNTIIKKIMRPKNQMKLPDDKNPSIVWDETKKQWVDKNAENDGITTSIKPPPKASDLQTFPGNINNLSSDRFDPTTLMSGIATKTDVSNAAFCIPGGNLPNVPPITSNNIYKLQKGRGMKANYVDVLSQKTKSSPSVSQQSSLNSMVDSSLVTSVPPKVNFFMPSSG